MSAPEKLKLRVQTKGSSKPYSFSEPVAALLSMLVETATKKIRVYEPSGFIIKEAGNDPSLKRSHEAATQVAGYVIKENSSPSVILIPSADAQENFGSDASTVFSKILLQCLWSTTQQ